MKKNHRISHHCSRTLDNDTDTQFKHFKTKQYMFKVNPIVDMNRSQLFNLNKKSLKSTNQRSHASQLNNLSILEA